MSNKLYDEIDKLKQERDALAQIIKRLARVYDVRVEDAIGSKAEAEALRDHVILEGHNEK